MALIKSLFEDDDSGKGEKPEPDRTDSSRRDKPGTMSLGLSDPEPEAPKKVPVEAQPGEGHQPMVEPFEITDLIGKPKQPDEDTLMQALLDSDSENLLELVVPPESGSDELPEIAILPSNGEIEATAESDKINITAKEFTPEPQAETIRKTGLAWSAAIILFGSVVFMMLLGWFADLRFGTQPWGIVVGIVIGSIVGFVQFFRTTSRILNPSKTDAQEHPLFSSQDDDDIP